MALFDYDEIAAEVVEIIAEFGQECVWRKLTTTGPDRKPTGSTPIDYNVTIVFVPHQYNHLKTLLAHMSDSEVPAGGVLGLMAAVEFEPEQGDVVFRGTDPNTAERLMVQLENGIEVIQPDNTQSALLYKIRLVR